MSLRLVRCPYCGKRFNVAGIVAGTRLRCGGCTAVLTVPRPEASSRPALRLTRSLVLQVAGGVAAGLVAAVALYVLLRPAPEPPPAPLAAVTTEKAVAKAPADSSLGGIDQELPAVDDPYARAQRRVQQEFGPSRFIFHKAKPYFVALETSQRFHSTMLAEDYGQRLETLYAAFRREFGQALQLPETDPPLLVIVFNSRETFDRYFLERDKKRMPDSIKGIYEYDSERRRVVVYHDYNVPSEVLFHEGVHQLVHYYTLRETGGRRVLGSYWFQEGLGTYFEGLRRGATGEFIDLGGGRDRLPTLKQALQPRDGSKRDFIPLNVLVGLTVDDFWQWFEERHKHEPEETTQKARIYYAESWAFVHFLRQKSGNHQKLFDDYFRRELAGRGGKESFEELVRHYLRTELPELEEEFIAYIQGLR